MALLACVRYKNCIILVKEEQQQQLARKYLYWQLLCTKFRPIKSTFVITLKVVIFSQMFIKLWNNYRDSSMIFTEVPCIKCSIYTTTSTSTELIWKILTYLTRNYKILPKCEISVSTSILILLHVHLFSHLTR